jgi:hypothetical protein
MLRKTLAVAMVAATTALAACSAGPTPYQPAAGYDRGYSEQKIEAERYRISFKGNSLTGRETVENYLLYRAAELTLQSGYDTFTIVNRDTDKDSDIRRTGGYGGFSRFSYMYFSPRWGWVHAWDPFFSSPARYDEVTRYEAYAEIVMSRGPKGDNANAFDARQVSQNLAASIQRPTS